MDVKNYIISLLKSWPLIQRCLLFRNSVISHTHSPIALQIKGLLLTSYNLQTTAVDKILAVCPQSPLLYPMSCSVTHPKTVEHYMHAMATKSASNKNRWFACFKSSQSCTSCNHIFMQHTLSQWRIQHFFVRGKGLIRFPFPLLSLQ